MEAALNSLPNEILEIIFSYCSHSDFLQSIQNVCCRWREVAQSTSLWKDVTYCPDHNTRSEQIVEMLENSPKLQNITLRNKYGDRVLQAITDNCVELRKLELIKHQDLDLNFIMNLQEKCPKVQYLRIPNRVLADLDKCEAVGKFANLKVLVLTGDPFPVFSMMFKPIADHCKELENVQICSTGFDINDFRHLLSIRKDTLHTLAVRCCNEFDECVLPALSTSALKSLTLFRYCDCRRHYEKIEYFGRLKTVRRLSIIGFHSYDESDDLKQIFENENMAQLVELKIQDSWYFDDNVSEVIVRNCPQLKYISLIKCYQMTDASLKIMSNLQELSSLTLCYDNRVTYAGVAHLQEVVGLKCRRMLWWKILENEVHYKI